MKNITVDLANATTEEKFHDVVYSSFSFPYYYGRNTDAFWDCINEIFEEIKVDVININCLSSEMRDYAGVYINLLQDYSGRREGKFILAIDGSATASP